MKNYNQTQTNVLFYDTIALIFGDDAKSRKIYIVLKLILVSFIFLLILINFTLHGISILDTMETAGIILYCLIIIAIIAIWISLYSRIYKKNYDNLHTIPVLKSVDLKEYKIKLIEPNGENVLIINCCNGFTIELIYKNNEYIVVIKNSEWDVIKQIKANTQDDISKALNEAIDFTISK